MITLISTPEYAEPTDPLIISRWLATESPNNFRLRRTDWAVTAYANAGGFLQITMAAYTGAVTDSIAVYDASTDSMYTGTITSIAGDPDFVTDITWVVGMDITYLNDNTLYGNYYFEGQLTINGVVETIHVIASPDSKGYADLDVSGLLRIAVSLGKIGDYTEIIMKETNKSGNFSFEYRGAWYGSDEAYTEEGETWYYAEGIRSEEQGSNLHEFVATTIYDAPFYNLFTEPVYFRGLPFDISFLMPETEVVSPESDITVTIKFYNSVNTQIGADVIYTIDADTFEGFMDSLNIAASIVPEGSVKFTAEIET